jgi:hypothetical protein
VFLEREPQIKRDFFYFPAGQNAKRGEDTRVLVYEVCKLKSNQQRKPEGLGFESGVVEVDQRHYYELFGNHLERYLWVTPAVVIQK